MVREAGSQLCRRRGCRATGEKKKKKQSTKSAPCRSLWHSLHCCHAGPAANTAAEAIVGKRGDEFKSGRSVRAVYVQGESTGQERAFSVPTSPLNTKTIAQSGFGSTNIDTLGGGKRGKTHLPWNFATKMATVLFYRWNRLESSTPMPLGIGTIVTCSSRAHALT